MKFVGSKARVAKYIVPILQRMIYSNNYSAYIEPFVGGANVIEHIDHPVRVGTDKSVPLIYLLKHIADGGRLPESVNKEMYDYYKGRAKEGVYTLMTGVCGYLASYNGKYFGGYAGKVHTKAGTVRDYYDEARRNLLKQAPKLKGCTFAVSDYRSIEFENGNVFIYADPPYSGTTGYNDDFNSKEFWDKVCCWHSQGNTVVVSEQQAPPDFECIWEMPVTRTLNHSGRQTVTEKLFMLRG